MTKKLGAELQGGTGSACVDVTPRTGAEAALSPARFFPAVASVGYSPRANWSPRPPGRGAEEALFSRTQAGADPLGERGLVGEAPEGGAEEVTVLWTLLSPVVCGRFCAHSA